MYCHTVTLQKLSYFQRRTGRRNILPYHTENAAEGNFSFGNRRVVSLLPGIKPADERMNLFPPILQKRLRHTGAGCFLWSSTIGHNRSLCRNLRQPRHRFLRGNPNRAHDFSVGFVPRFRRTGVEKNNLLASLEVFIDLFGCPFGQFHFLFPLLLLTSIEANNKVECKAGCLEDVYTGKTVLYQCVRVEGSLQIRVS